MIVHATLIFLSNLALVGGLGTFHTTYSYGDEKKQLDGFEPDGNSTGLPVYLYVMGTGDTYGALVDDEWLKAMANRGFIAGAVEYPNPLSELFEYGDKPKVLFQRFQEKAKKIAPNAISEMCKRPRANCSAGVAMAGHSQGGFISSFSIRYESRITAIMPLGTGCVDEDGDEKLHAELGLTDAEMSKYLPTGQRLYISGENDTLTHPSKCLPMFTSGTYMLVPKGPHNFYGCCDPALKETKMKCSYGESSEPWGLQQASDWLANAASPTKAIQVSGKIEIECDKQAISDTSDCFVKTKEIGSLILKVLMAIIGMLACCVLVCVYCCCCRTTRPAQARQQMLAQPIVDSQE